MFVLACLVVVESVRLLLGQQHEPVDFDNRMSAIFRILVLTVPSMHGVVYFTFWQTFVTRLDAALGLIMLLIQVMQFFSAILCWWPKVPSIKQTLQKALSLFSMIFILHISQRVRIMYYSLQSLLL